jgi:hypothetical protein
MSGFRIALSLLLFGSVTLQLAGGCAQDPGSNTRCVFESGAVQTGACLTQCESQCSLEDRAGCASKNCVSECEKAAPADAGVCADASYAHWRCLRLVGLPLVECSGGKASLIVPNGECRAEREREQEACLTVDAGIHGDGDR